MLGELYQIFLWSNIPVALLALVGSVDIQRRVIGDPELLKALSAVMAHFFFVQFWFAFVRPESAVGQPWLLYCISLFIVAWVVTVRPASKFSAIICWSCMFGVLTSGVAGVYHLMAGYSATIDLYHWVCIFVMGCLNLLILASWSCGNIGNRIRVRYSLTRVSNGASKRGVAR